MDIIKFQRRNIAYGKVLINAKAESTKETSGRRYLHHEMPVSVWQKLWYDLETYRFIQVLPYEIVA